jgi:hypothetical protein
MKNQDEIIEIIIDLQEKGFDHDFTIEHENIRCLQYDELIAPDGFDIVEMYRCNPKAKPGNNSIIYGIKLKHYEVKGILMSNYRSYISGMSVQLWQKFDSFLKDQIAAA